MYKNAIELLKKEVNTYKEIINDAGYVPGVKSNSEKSIKEYEDAIKLLSDPPAFSNVNSCIEKRSELMEKLYNTYILNVEDDGMPKASVMELVKLHEECDDILYGC